MPRPADDNEERSRSLWRCCTQVLITTCGFIDTSGNQGRGQPSLWKVWLIVLNLFKSYRRQKHTQTLTWHYYSISWTWTDLKWVKSKSLVTRYPKEPNWGYGGQEGCSGKEQVERNVWVIRKRAWLKKFALNDWLKEVVIGQRSVW